MQRNEIGSKVEGTVIFAGRDRFLLVFSAAISIALLVQVLFYARYGIDVTDESFYLLSIANPEFWEINIPASMFGFVYHPVFLLLDGDISAMRRANVLLSFLLSFLMCVTISREFLFRRDAEKINLIFFSLSLSSLSLFGFYIGLTPSYNSLAFHAILITISGVIYCGKNEKHWQVTGCLFVALGGWLVFLAKPSSALALAISVLICGCFLGRKYLVSVCFSGCISLMLLLITAIYIDGSVGSFFARLRDSIELLQASGSGHEFYKVFRINGFKLIWHHYLIALLAVIIVFSAKILNHQSLPIRLAALFMILVIGCCSILFGFGFANSIIGSAKIFFAFAIFLILAAAFLYSRIFFDSFARWRLVIGVFLLLTPLIYSFGSNQNYWSIGAQVSIFWVLSTLVFISPITSRGSGILLLIPLAFIVQVFSSSLVGYSITHPFRQPHSLRENVKIQQLSNGGNLVLSDEFYRYFSDVQMAAQRAGFLRGMHAIDLTGLSPGILYLIGARSLGQPWMVGYYPGGDHLAVSTLRRETCDDIASAWLLIEPAGPRSLSVDAILNTIGGNRISDYEIVASFFTAEYAGGYRDKREQNMLRPKRSLAVAREACLSAREN